jgi:hypothetical protein
VKDEIDRVQRAEDELAELRLAMDGEWTARQLARRLRGDAIAALLLMLLAFVVFIPIGAAAAALLRLIFTG